MEFKNINLLEYIIQIKQINLFINNSNIIKKINLLLFINLVVKQKYNLLVNKTK